VRSLLSKSSPLQHERHPAFERDALLEDEAARNVRRQRRDRLAAQQAREHDPSARCEIARDRRRQALQWLEQDVREDEVMAPGEAPDAETVRAHELDQSRGAVETHIGARNAHRNRIDVACHHPAAQGAGRRNGEHASPAADVEDLVAARHDFATYPGEWELRRRPERLHDPIKCQQAAAGGAVVTGAEGERGFDLDCDPIEGGARAIMWSMHHEPPGLDGL